MDTAQGIMGRTWAGGRMQGQVNPQFAAFSGSQYKVNQRSPEQLQAEAEANAKRYPNDPRFNPKVIDAETGAPSPMPQMQQPSYAFNPMQQPMRVPSPRFDPLGVFGKGFMHGAKGVPVNKLNGQPFWTGEDGPELQMIKDGKLTVIPNHVIESAGVKAPEKRQAMAFAEEADGKGYADGTGFGTPFRSIAESYKPIGSDSNPGGGMEWTGTGWAHPTKMRRTDERRFLQSPQGIGFQMQQKAQGQAFDRHQQAQTSAMQMERGWQTADKEAAKQAKVDEEAKQGAAYDQIFSALTTDKAALPPVFNDLIASAKDVRGKAALHDLVLGYLGHKASGDETARRQMEAEQGKAATGADFVTDPSGVFGLPMVRHADGTKSLAGSAMALPKPMEQMTDAEIAAHVRSGATVTTKRGDATLKYAPQAVEQPRNPLVRERRVPGKIGQPDTVDYVQFDEKTRTWGPMPLTEGTATKNDWKSWANQ